jgi:DNA-binding MarR family transcriptional regulator
MRGTGIAHGNGERAAKKSAPADRKPTLGPTLCPTLGPLENFIGFHLRLAQEASFRAFARRAANPHLKPGRFALIALIGENSGITPTALSRISGRDKSSITPALHDLEHAGLVRRRLVPEDHRSCRLWLTESGQAMLRELMVHACAHDEELDRIVGVENKAQFIDQLRRLVRALA